MKKIVIVAVLSLSFTAIHAQFWNKVKKNIPTSVTSGSSALTEEEVGKGLKEALNKGVEKGVSQLSKPDGYFKDLEIKIPMPETAKKVEGRLRSMGQGQKVDEAILSMNRAAEDAATLAKQLFVEAIKNMTITDAMTILKGEKNAATHYLKKSTSSALTIKFKPIIKTSLDKVGATKHWETVFSTYNKIPLVDKVNPNLEEYVTEKAINGLFIQVAKEELQIRENPAARVTDLLKKVFGK